MFTVTHVSGAMSQPGDLDALDALLVELDDQADDEHPDVSVTHESGWSLGVFQSRLVIWENVEVENAEGPRHMRDVREEKVRSLMRAVAEGRLSDVAAEPWLPGYGA